MGWLRRTAFHVYLWWVLRRIDRRTRWSEQAALDLAEIKYRRQHHRTAGK